MIPFSDLEHELNDSDFQRKTTPSNKNTVKLGYSEQFAARAKSF